MRDGSALIPVTYGSNPTALDPHATHTRKSRRRPRRLKEDPGPSGMASGRVGRGATGGTLKALREFDEVPARTRIREGIGRNGLGGRDPEKNPLDRHFELLPVE